MLNQHKHTTSAPVTDAILSAAKGEVPSQPTVFQIVLSFPPIVDYDGLSQLLGRNVRTLQADRSRNPESVPTPYTPPGSRPLWVVQDVIAWLQQHRNQGRNRKTQKRKAGPGASTKAERIAAEEAGLSVKEWRETLAQKEA